MNINKVLIPNKPHLDPVAAIYLLKKYGEKKYPGVDKAEVVFWEKGVDPTRRDAEQFIRNGVLMLDMGGGDFDHHSIANNVVETSTSLVAKDLGIDKNPEINSLLGYIREDDLEGLHNRFGDLAFLLKNLYKQGYSSKEVVEFSLELLDIFQRNQYEFYVKTKKEYEEKIKIYKVKRNKSKIKVGIIESDNVQMSNYALTQANLAVSIQRRSTGHVMILTNKMQKINLREIIAAIRMRELELTGYKKEIDPRRLQYEGKSNLVPNWFYHRSLNSFLNGSDALNKTEATVVPFKEIVKFVIYGLTTDVSKLCDCGEGGKKCPYRKYGFSKCSAKYRLSFKNL